MRKALVTALTTITLVGGGMAVALPAHAAATLVVDLDGMGAPGDCNSSTAAYSSITDAVTAANDGDTIVVCPGTYTENVTTAKSLTFQGAQAGMDARTRSGSGETTVDGGGGTAFSLSGANSVIDGFTLIGATANPGAPTPAVFVNGNGTTVANDIFTGNDAAAIIIADSATFNQNKVTAVSVNNGAAGGYGFFFNSNTGSGSSVTNNAFGGQLDGGAINVADPTPLNGLTITGNTADTSVSGNFAVLGGTRNVLISGNTVTGGANSGTGILFLGDDAGYTVTSNVVTGLNASAVSLAGGFGYTTSNGGGTISQNAFKNNLRGINVTEMDGAAKLIANLNILVGNTSGGTADSPNAAIRNITTATVSAQNNYYGCQTGPNTAGCDATLNTGGGILDDDPWLVLSTTVGASSIPKGGTTSFTADLNHNSDGNVVSGTVLDDVETATFSFTKGSVNPASAPIVNGTAQTTLTGTTTGTGTASAKVESSTSSKQVTVTASTLPALTIHDAGRAEGNSGTHPMTFQVTMSKASTHAVTVHFTTVNGSAKAGSDYVAKTGVLTIPAGHKSGTISILINGDRTKEPNELFAVNLYSPTNARISDPTGTGTIRNDD
jgi:hypothetical protein